MDVVDTLRHREGVALRELEQEGRDDLLKERLRGIYEDQGLAVSDRILEEGIRALREPLHLPAHASQFSRTLAGLWVKRKFIGTALAAAVFLAAVWMAGRSGSIIAPSGRRSRAWNHGDVAKPTRAGRCRCLVSS